MKYAWGAVAIACGGVNAMSRFEQMYLSPEMTLINEIDFALEAANEFEQTIMTDNVNLLNDNLADVDYIITSNKYNLPYANVGMN